MWSKLRREPSLLGKDGGEEATGPVAFTELLPEHKRG